jgi:hypothetical protein
VRCVFHITALMADVVNIYDGRHDVPYDIER